jgi:hypothetical protein
MIFSVPICFDVILCDQVIESIMCRHVLLFSAIVSIIVLDVIFVVKNACRW